MLNLSNSPALLKGGAFFIDNSTFESVQACDRMAYYRVVQKRELGGKANALNFGGAFHAGLDTRYRVGGYSHDSLSDQQLAGIAYLNDHPTDDWRSAELLVEALAGYAREYSLEPWQIVAASGADGQPRPFVELPFAVPMGSVTLSEPITMPNLRINIEGTGDPKVDYTNIALTDVGELEMITLSEIPIVWTGKIDLVIINNGEYWICDHKTTSVFGDSYFEQYKLSSQFFGYKWAIEQMLKIPIVGTMINVIAVRKPTKTGKNTTFHRQFMRTEQHLVPEWHANTMYLLSEFFSSLQNGYFPMRFTSCRTKWHRNCEYIGVCTLPADQREMYLATGDFQNVTWSPLREE